MVELTLRVLLHSALGIVLTAVVWVVGLAYLGAAGRGRVDRLTAVDAYPVGLLAVVVATVLVLVHPWLALLAGAVLLAPALVPSNLRRLVDLGGAAVAPLLWALPAVFGFSIVLGLLLHGPDEELDSNAFGDMFFYVNKLVSAGDSLAPFRDLLAEGQSIIYVEGAPSFVGAVLADLPGFDVVLFHTTTLPTFWLASVCIGLGLVARQSPRLGLPWLGILALLFVAMLPYPTWLTESPPLAFSLPLAFSMYRLWEDERVELTRFVVLAAVIAVDLLLTKVVATIPLAVVVIFVLYRRYRGHPSFGRIALLVAAGLAVAAAVLITVLFLTASWYARLFKLEFFPARAARELWSQFDTRSTQKLAPALTVIGQVLLLAALLRIRSWPFAAALGAGLAASWFLGGQAFDGAIGTANLLAALVFWQRPELLRDQRWLVGAAAGTLACSVWFREIYGVRTGLVLVALGAFALLPALAPHVRRTGFALAAASLLALGGAWAGDVRLTGAAVTLTPADYEIWHRVAELVPPDGLVFTTMTGKEVGPRAGWNNYPSIAGRQLYLAGWYDGRLTSEPEEVDRRLELNARVLAGLVTPTDLGLSRAYGSYFAVTRRYEDAPDSFLPLYANRDFALYRMP
jgi:hypothetical protein